MTETITLRAYLNELQNMLERDASTEVVSHSRYILQHFPQNVETYRLLAQALLQRGHNEGVAAHFNEAAEVFRRVLSVVPNDYVAHLGLSEISEQVGDLDRAIWHMERAYEQIPGNQTLQAALRELYGKRDGADNAPAKIQLTRAALARQYANGQLFDQALIELRNALEADPDRVDLEVMLVETLWDSQHPIEAGEAAIRLLKKLPMCLSANLVLARLWLENERPTDAQRFVDRLVALDPYLAASVLQPDTEVTDTNVLDRLDYSTQAARAALSEEPDWVQELSGMDMGNVFSLASETEAPDGSEFDSEESQETVELESGLPGTAGEPSPELDVPNWFADGGDLEADVAPVEDTDDTWDADWLTGVSDDLAGMPATPDSELAGETPAWFAEAGPEAETPAESEPVEFDTSWLSGDVEPDVPDLSPPDSEALASADWWADEAEASSGGDLARGVPSADSADDWASLLGEEGARSQAEQPAEFEADADWLAGGDEAEDLSSLFDDADALSGASDSPDTHDGAEDWSALFGDETGGQPVTTGDEHLVGEQEQEEDVTPQSLEDVLKASADLTDVPAPDESQDEEDRPSSGFTDLLAGAAVRSASQTSDEDDSGEPMPPSWLATFEVEDEIAADVLGEAEPADDKLSTGGEPEEIEDWLTEPDLDFFAATPEPETAAPADESRPVAEPAGDETDDWLTGLSEADSAALFAGSETTDADDMALDQQEDWREPTFTGADEVHDRQSEDPTDEATVGSSGADSAPMEDILAADSVEDTLSMMEMFDPTLTDAELPLEDEASQGVELDWLKQLDSTDDVQVEDAAPASGDRVESGMLSFLAESDEDASVPDAAEAFPESSDDTLVIPPDWSSDEGEQVADDRLASMAESEQPAASETDPRDMAVQTGEWLAALPELELEDVVEDVSDADPVSFEALEDDLFAGEAADSGGSDGDDSAEEAASASTREVDASLSDEQHEPVDVSDKAPSEAEDESEVSEDGVPSWLASVEADFSPDKSSSASTGDIPSEGVPSAAKADDDAALFDEPYDPFEGGSPDQVPEYASAKETGILQPDEAPDWMLALTGELSPDAVEVSDLEDDTDVDRGGHEALLDLIGVSSDASPEESSGESAETEDVSLVTDALTDMEFEDVETEQEHEPEPFDLDALAPPAEEDGEMPGWLAAITGGSAPHSDDVFEAGVTDEVLQPDNELDWLAPIGETPEVAADYQADEADDIALDETDRAAAETAEPAEDSAAALDFDELDFGAAAVESDDISALFGSEPEPEDEGETAALDFDELDFDTADFEAVESDDISALFGSEPEPEDKGETAALDFDELDFDTADFEAVESDDISALFGSEPEPADKTEADMSELPSPEVQSRDFEFDVDRQLAEYSTDEIPETQRVDVSSEDDFALFDVESEVEEADSDTAESADQEVAHPGDLADTKEDETEVTAASIRDEAGDEELAAQFSFDDWTPRWLRQPKESDQSEPLVEHDAQAESPEPPEWLRDIEDDEID